MKWLFIPVFILANLALVAQKQQDSLVQQGEKMITLREVVLDKKLNVPALIHRIQTDSSFYKAFKNLRILGYTSWNDIRILDRSGRLKASLQGKTRQHRSGGCRTMEVLEQTVTGDMYEDDSSFHYYTPELYASLFFTKGKLCGETNLVSGKSFSTEGLSGMEKHKQQLKMLFFNPGQRISGLPFMSGKTAIYDDEMADRYDFEVDWENHAGQSCYVFRQTVKPGQESRVVIDQMTTWFNDSTFDVVARNWHLSYDAGFYDFDVNMEVSMGRFNQLMVPVLIRYNGNWKAIFRKRERAVFTATLFDFVKED